MRETRSLPLLLLLFCGLLLFSLSLSRVRREVRERLKQFSGGDAADASVIMWEWRVSSFFDAIPLPLLLLFFIYSYFFYERVVV